MIRRRLRLWEALTLAALSVLIAASLTGSMSLEPYYVADSALDSLDRLPRFLAYCIRSFQMEQTLGCFLTVGAGLLLWGVSRIRPTPSERVLAAVFGVLFSMTQVVGRSFAEVGSWNALFGSLFVEFRAAVIFSGKALLAACVVLYAFRMVDHAPKLSPAPAFSWKRFLLTAGAVALCYLPYYLYFYPGLGNPDTNMQMAWALHYPTEWLQYSPIRGEDVFATNHHPYFTTVLFGLFARLGLTLGNIRYGVGLYCLLQLLALALITTAIWTYLRRLGLGVRVCRGGLVFTALFPLFPLYGITMLKDPLFSLILLTFSFLLLELARTGGVRLRDNRFCALLFFNALLVTLTKNQGVYFVAVTALAVLIFFPFRLRAAAALLAPALLFQFVWIGVLLPAWNVAPGGKQEVLGLLFQQTARYVSTYPEDVTEEEAEAIRAVIDYDRLPELYNPTLSDDVKFTYNQDCTEEDRAAYFRAWAQMFRRHPGVYIQAAIHNAYGGFYVERETALSYIHFDLRPLENYPWLQIPMPPHRQAAEPLIRYVLKALQHIPGLGILFRIGAYPWAVLFLFLDALRRRQYARILPQLPCILTVGVLFLAPVSGSYRYAMPFALTLPFLLATLLLPSCGPWPGENPKQRNPLWGQILRFTLVGGLCFLIDYGLLALLVEAAGWSALAASAASFTVSVLVNYLLSVRFVFRRREDAGRGREMLVFLLMSAAGLGLNQLLMLIGTRSLGLHYLIVKPAAAILVLVYNFVTRKLFLEKRPLPRPHSAG